MSQSIEKYVSLIGRILLTAIFLLSGFNKIFGWEGTAAYMTAKGMVAVPIMLAGAIFFEIVGALMIILGFHARIGALMLIIFLIPTTLIFHNFWTYPVEEQQIQMIMFMKNLGLLGGLLIVAAFGSGPLSLDSQRRKILL